MQQGTNNWNGSRNINGTFYTGNLINTTTYYITCTNASGYANDSVTVTVRNQLHLLLHHLHHLHQYNFQL